MIIAVILKANQPEIYKLLLTMLPAGTASEIAGIRYEPPVAVDGANEFIYLKRLMEERRGVNL